MAQATLQGLDAALPMCALAVIEGTVGGIFVVVSLVRDCPGNGVSGV